MDLPAIHALEDSPAQTQSDLRVSIVVPTRNRSALLRELIDSLWRQTLPPSKFEIIVVDNLSTDDTPQVVEKLKQESVCQLLYHRMIENRGPVHSRNHGAGLAHAEILAFIDSDCRAHPEWLERGLSGFDQDVAFVSGTIFDKPGQEVKFFSRRNEGPLTENVTYPACNIFYRKNIFNAMGGFDEAAAFPDFRQRPVEFADTDLAWRIKEAGYKNCFRADATVYHEVETQTPINWLLEPLRLFFVPAVIRRHPGLRKHVLRWRIFFYTWAELFYLAAIGCALAIVFHPAFFLLAGPFIYRIAHIPGRPLSLKRIPRILGRVVLLAARQFLVSLTFLYGSIRFRELVL